MQRFDGTNSGKSEGYCLKCAKEMGIKPISDFMDKMGIDEEQMDYISEEMAGLMDESGLFDPTQDPDQDEGDEDDDLLEEGRAPSIELGAMFSPQREKGEKEQEKGDGKQKHQKKRKSLDSYCIDLTRRARDGKLDKVIGRSRELDRVLQILCRRQKNNPCLIGEPGVGKTAVAEALAQRIADDDVPYKLKNHEVHLLDMTAMVAGTQFRGQFENRMKALIEEVKASGNVILVIDEVHSIVSAGDAEGGMNAANILKPALSRGDIQVIGATTLAEYRKYIEKDAALERRFQPIVINEPSMEDTVKILKGIRSYYEDFHGVRIPDETIEKAVVYSERYITDRFLPDKAIDLLDESAAYVALRDPCISQTEQAKSDLDRVTAEREALENQPEEQDEQKNVARYRAIADLKSMEIKAKDEYEALLEKRKGISLRPEHLAAVVEIWTGIPASSINESEFLRIEKLEDRLKQRIVGQDRAISAVARAIKRSRAGISSKRKPVSFIFAGPTGVGKTELVKTLANDLFDAPEALIRLDMSEFMEKHSVSRIIGAPPGYVGYDESGQLTEKVRRRPYCVILFDEIEKAHPDVMNILLQILDDGKITDAHGKEVDFCNAMIVMTTNAGSQGGMNTAGFLENGRLVSEDRVQKALAEFLRPEFLNRIDEVIVFNHLTQDDFVRIAGIMMEDSQKALAEKDITLTWTKEVLAALADKSFSVKYGARNLRRLVQTEIEDQAANLIISHYDRKVTKISVFVREGKIETAGEEA